MFARILVIDDNTSLAQNLRDVLEGARELDVEVILAPDGKSGLFAAREGGFDVAVVDVKLPDASGVALMPSLRAAAPLGEIVLVTGFATIDTALEALRAGAFAFILKSFRPEELIATVQQAIEKVGLKREREEYQRRYRALVDATDVLILGLDRDGNVVLFNQRLAELTGVSASEALGQRLSERFVAPPDARRVEQAITLASAGEASDVEVTMVTEEGVPRRVRWHLSAVRESRDDLAVYGIGVDVTERRALERRAASAEALNAMAPLALGLAHEIRNPLNAAVLELELLSRAIERLGESEARDPMRSRVGIVKGEIGRLERLLTEFLELARPRGLQREPVDLGLVLGEVIDLELEAITARGITLEREIEPGCVALGDVEKLKQVVLNLVVNALDVMPEGGVIRVCTGADESRVWMAIGDSGPGIDPAILAEIFDPFFTTKPAGTGLGLAIVHKIVQQHGGDVRLESQATSGTVARVTLPRARSDEPRDDAK